MVPGKTQIVVLALAITGGIPVATSIGKRINEPPPATALIIPARQPPNRNRAHSNIPLFKHIQLSDWGPYGTIE